MLMYRKIENSPRMTESEATERYPDSYILMQLDSSELFDPAGIVLYIGDDGDELFSLQIKLPVPRGVVIEGINISRRLSLGGLVVGA
jgi:hypothetical protein